MTHPKRLRCPFCAEAMTSKDSICMDCARDICSGIIPTQNQILVGELLLSNDSMKRDDMCIAHIKQYNGGLR